MRPPVWLSLLIIICAVALGGTSARADKASAAQDTATAELMCQDAPADYVKPLPVPFNFWIALVCAPESQALVPAEGSVWRIHGSKDFVSILALPPGVTPLPKTKDYDPSYAVRFKSFFATEAKGSKRDHALSLLAAAQQGDVKPLTSADVDRIYQLDAVSNIYERRYNIFFYLKGKQPRVALACIDECRQAIFFDILKDDETAKKRAAR